MKKGNVFWGLLLVLACVLIVVNQLGLFIGIGIFEIVATIILIGMIVKSVVRISFPGILFPAALLCIIYADELNITELTPWPVLLVAILGSVGLNMIFKNGTCGPWVHGPHGVHHKEQFSEVINQPDGNVVNCTASFASSMKYINTDNLERANLKSSFGAMKVYFDNAIVSPNGATIYLDVSFSGMELYIPKNWNLVNKVNSSFGSVEEKNRRMESNSPVVVLEGNVSFGGVEIIYV